MSNLSADIRRAIIAMADAPLRNAATALLSTLGYSSRKTIQLDGSPQSFVTLLDGGSQLVSKPAAQFDQWQRVDFLFQLTNDEIPMLAAGQRDLLQAPQDYRTSIIESFVFLAIELKPGDWTRRDLISITREVNRAFPMPAIILFRYGNLVSIAVIDRRQNKKDGTRDVIERRISIIKDVNLSDPHRAQVDILKDLALENIKVRGLGTPSNFRDLYSGWLEVLSAQALNKKFYQELEHWYRWSTTQVTFPTAHLESDQNKRNQQNQIAVIRLLTRLIFVWFIKEKGLVPGQLFDTASLRELLNEDPGAHPDSSTYYKAILQNLFFATLNTDEASEGRDWRSKGEGRRQDGQYLIHTFYRYHDSFRDPGRALKVFRSVPFLNGGLFECLDREVTARDLERNPALKNHIVREGTHDIIRIDGFSERSGNPLCVPNKIFFSPEQLVAPDADQEGENAKPYKAMGLIELFSHYKFTVEENTPVEEEVALDPELLGKVFENLLASYNSDTRTSARKNSGSFYTPREVVDYMVDEALIAYFNNKIPDAAALSSDFEARIHDLLSPGHGNPFSEAETDAIVGAIDSLRALDPACGSGAFPMGLLQKLIHILHRLDPDNKRWHAQNRKPLEDQRAAALAIPDPTRRDAVLEDVEAALAKLDHDFSNANLPDYARKLYLIDKCLFGVDLQPIAVQIAKLRFFISLVVSQKIDPDQPNLNITALPNLETKLVAANSLKSVERPRQQELFRDPRIMAKEEELHALNAIYFSARSAKTKRHRREQIGRLRDELAELLVASHAVSEHDARMMASWDQFDQNASADFFDPEWMFQMQSPDTGMTDTESYRVGPFDLVIGNPPYVRHETIKDQKKDYERLYGGKDTKGNPKGAYSGTADLLVYFIQRGIELLKPGGAFAYITSNKWYRAKYGAPLRHWFNRNAKMCHVIDFGDAEVFDALAYPTIIIATRRKEPVQVANDTDMLRVLNWPADRDRSEVAGFAGLIETLGFDLPQKSLANEGWQLEPQAKRGLLEHIRAAGTPLHQHIRGKMYIGVKTALNKAYVIDDETREHLIKSDKKSAELIKPFVRGRDIKRWKAENHNQYILQIESSDNKIHPWSGRNPKEAEEIFAKYYPAVYEHFRPHFPDLIKRTDKGRYFWELRSCAYWEEFAKEKIVWPDIALTPQFCWSDSTSIVDMTAFIMTGVDKWILAVLNSSTWFWYFSQFSSQIQNGYYRFKAQYCDNIPVPNVTERQRGLVENAVNVMQQNSDLHFEQLLNGFVYELFFQDDLYTRALTIFDEAERAGLGAFAGLEGQALMTAAERFAAQHLVPGARLRTMLSDLQTLDVVRIIEGRE